MARQPGRPTPYDRKRNQRIPKLVEKNDQGKEVCGAKKRDGTPCMSPLIYTQTKRCRLHRGAALSGILAPAYKTGRYSQDLPSRLLPKLEQALQDPELLSTREDVALVQAMILDELASIQQAQMNPDLDAVIDKTQDIAKNWATYDWTKMQREMDALVELMTSKQNEKAALREVRVLLQEKSALMAQEQRRLSELQQTMTIEQVIILAQSMVSVVRQVIGDLPDANERLRLIAADFRAITSLPEPANPRVATSKK